VRNPGGRERVVPPRLDGARQSGEDAASVVPHEARLAVEECPCLSDLAPEGLDDGLMTEADAEGRRRRPEDTDQLDRVAGPRGSTGTGGDDEPIGGHQPGSGDVDL